MTCIRVAIVDTLSETDLPLDVSYIDLTEVEYLDNSEVDWIFNEVDVNEQTPIELPPVSNIVKVCEMFCTNIIIKHVGRGSQVVNNNNFLKISFERSAIF